MVSPLGLITKHVHVFDFLCILVTQKQVLLTNAVSTQKQKVSVIVLHLRHQLTDVPLVAEASVQFPVPL